MHFARYARLCVACDKQVEILRADMWRYLCPGRLISVDSRTGRRASRELAEASDRRLTQPAARGTGENRPKSAGRAAGLPAVPGDGLTQTIGQTDVGGELELLACQGDVRKRVEDFPNP